MRFEFDGPLWRWEARTEDWYFITMPAELGGDIAEMPRMRRGFGAVKVEATIGATRWRTSIFPQQQVPGVGQEYVLPVKKAVRVAEKLEPGAEIHVAIELVQL